MQVPPLFLPEGHIDKALTRALVVYHRDFDALVNRKQGASGVANAMALQWDRFGPKRRVVGIVDNDKKIYNVGYLAEFSAEVKPYGFDAPEAAHRICQHPARPSQYLVMLDPACDTWVWQAAISAGLSLASYKLPAGRKEFVKYSKDNGLRIGTDPAMLQLLLDIERAQPALFASLANFVSRIMDLDHPV